MITKVTRTRIILAAAGLGVAALVAYSMRPKPLVVDTSTVDRGPLETTVDADGRTRVRERYVVVAPVSGRVERIPRLEGAPVRAGEIVARLMPLPLDSLSAAQARARVDAASALALEAAAQVRVASASLDQRRRELSRAQRLAEVGGVAPRVVEEAQLAEVQAREAARAAQQRSVAAEADVRQARAAFLGQERGTAAMVLVRAPAGGRILHVTERSERIVAAGTPLLEVGDPASLERVVINLVIIDQQRYTGGFNGITDLATFELFGVEFGAYSVSTYYLAAGFLTLLLFLGLALMNSKTGLILQAIRDDETRVRYFGYDVANYQNFIFCVSAAVAGLAGMLYTLVMEFASPTFLAVPISLSIVIWCAVGGRASLLGAALGAIVVTGVQGSLSDSKTFLDTWMLIMGALFIVVVLFLPNGLISIVDVIRGRRERRRMALPLPSPRRTGIAAWRRVAR